MEIVPLWSGGGRRDIDAGTRNGLDPADGSEKRCIYVFLEAGGAMLLADWNNLRDLRILIAEP